MMNSILNVSLQMAQYLRGGQYFPRSHHELLWSKENVAGGGSGVSIWWEILVVRTLRVRLMFSSPSVNKLMTAWSSISKNCTTCILTTEVQVTLVLKYSCYRLSSFPLVLKPGMHSCANFCRREDAALLWERLKKCHSNDATLLVSSVRCDWLCCKLVV